MTTFKQLFEDVMPKSIARVHTQRALEGLGFRDYNDEAAESGLNYDRYLGAGGSLFKKNHLELNRSLPDLKAHQDTLHSTLKDNGWKRIKNNKRKDPKVLHSEYTHPSGLSARVQGLGYQTMLSLHDDGEPS